MSGVRSITSEGVICHQLASPPACWGSRNQRYAISVDLSRLPLRLQSLPTPLFSFCAGAYTILLHLHTPTINLAYLTSPYPTKTKENPTNNANNVVLLKPDVSSAAYLHITLEIALEKSLFEGREDQTVFLVCVLCRR